MLRKHFCIKIFILTVLSITFTANTPQKAASQSQSRKVEPVNNAQFQAEHFFDKKNSIFDKGKVNLKKGWIGIYMENEIGKGIKVKMVVKGSPADIAGIKGGDLVTEINGTNVINEKDDTSNLIVFKKVIEDAGRGNVVDVKAGRAGNNMEFKVKLSPKLLPIGKTGKNSSNFFIKKLENRTIDKKKSFVEFMLKKDKDFKKKCSKTIQRIGEEIFAREGYQNASETNVFRLELIDYLMTHPFDINRFCELMHKEAASSDPAKTFNAVAGLLGSTNSAGLKGDENDGNVQMFIENMLNNVVQYALLRKKALAGLTDDEIGFLYSHSPKIWLNSDGVDTSIFAKYLELAGKIDIPNLIEPFRLVAASINVENLIKLEPKSRELKPFNIRGLSDLRADGKADGARTNEPNESGFGGDVLFIQDTEIGKIVVGGPGATYYYDDAAFIFDIGGNDYYFNNAGASRLNALVSICVDFSGDDVYNSKTDFSQGAGRLGAGILIDLEGDDKYVGGDYCQGFGLLGVGLFYDANGDDLINSQEMSQGGAVLGTGLLIDKNGNDNYISNRFSQGIGLTMGVGGIIDMAGHDNYFTGSKYADFRDPNGSFQSFSQGFAMGMRPDDTILGASGGIGFLFDEGGNDTYHGDYFAQGSSYYFSLGLLYDKKGHDKYYAGRYSQGAGIHSSIGVLKDDEGNDFYHASFGVSQACGFDTGIGYLVDLKGDDFYKSRSMAQGVGGEKGLGFLADFMGNDFFHMAGEGQGYSYPSKNETFFGIGILCDIGGDADVLSKDIENNAIIYQGNAGILMNLGN